MNLCYRFCQSVFLGKGQGANMFDLVHGHFDEKNYEVAAVEGSLGMEGVMYRLSVGLPLVWQPCD